MAAPLRGPGRVGPHPRKGPPARPHASVPVDLGQGSRNGRLTTIALDPPSGSPVPGDHDKTTPMSRSIRILAAVLALVSMLFTQLAVAAYRCPTGLAEQEAPAVMSMAADGAHDMENCTERQEHPSALCHAHCQPDEQSLDRTPFPDVSPFVPASMVATLAPALPVLSPARSPGVRPLMERVTSPPLPIRFCCFRI